MLQISNDKCTGCEMCKEICPVNAISFVVKDGFRVPVVDEAKCVDCDLCNKRCPAQKDMVAMNSFPEVYAAWTKNVEQREICTSGGICYEMSKCVIEQGGLVAGVVWRDNYRNAEYRLISNISELPLITQTKYFQPEMNAIFSKIKEQLEKNKLVMFIGTSCSNEGLKAYLGKMYDNLICCDFICRGYTSQLYHQKRVDELEKKYDSKMLGVYYKNKSLGWEQFGTKFDFENGKSFYINRDKDPYEFMLQIDDYLTRLSCINCKYRNYYHNSDITVGDFWGIGNATSEDKKRGISAVLINSSKGEDLFNNIKDSICYEQRTVYEISRGNPCLKGQLNYHEGREKFYQDLEKCSIEYMHNKYGNIKKYKMKQRIKLAKKAIKLFMNIDVVAFIHYNFLCKEVTRYKKKFIFPYRGTKINIEKKSRLEIKGNLFLNNLKHKHSNEQTYLHICKGGLLVINGTTRIAAESTIEILERAKLSIGSFDSNYNLIIVCANEINIGYDVEGGRNVTIYDSNFHQTGMTRNIRGRALNIGDHVWLCTGVSVAKGLNINDGAICGLNATVTRNVAERTMVLGNPAKKTIEEVEW